MIYDSVIEIMMNEEDVYSAQVPWNIFQVYVAHSEFKLWSQGGNPWLGRITCRYAVKFIQNVAGIIRIEAVR